MPLVLNFAAKVGRLYRIAMAGAGGAKSGCEAYFVPQIGCFYGHFRPDGWHLAGVLVLAGGQQAGAKIRQILQRGRAFGVLWLA